MVEREYSAESEQIPRVSEELLKLADVESGIGFIYAALGFIANRYRLRDIAVVLVSNSFGTQIFRLEGRAVNPASVGELGLHPGVYCVPDIVSKDDVDALYAACQAAYSSQYVRHNVARQSGEPESTSNHYGPSWIVDPSRHSDGDTLTATNRLTKPSRRRVASSRGVVTRAYFSRVLLLIDIAIFAMTVAGVHGPERLVLGLVLGVVIPGWCVIAPLKLNNPALEFGLTLAISMSLLMFAAQILITVDLWHLVALEELTAIACFPFLLYQAIRPGRRAG